MPKHNVTIEHPTGRDNFSVVSVGDLIIWFSYRTPVAIAGIGLDEARARLGLAGGRRIVRRNDWGPTTGKHLNYIDGGDTDCRVSGEDFEAILASLDVRVAVAA